MFAAACILLLTPILFYRLNQGDHLVEVPPQLGPLSYAALVFGEFVKALPVFDYSEVYELGYFTGVAPAPPIEARLRRSNARTFLLIGLVSRPILAMPSSPLGSAI